MMIAPQILAKVAKLIRLLSSDKPGEAVGTVHAIRRTLAGAGLDLHDLAHMIEAGGLQAAPESKPKPSDETTEWQSLAARILREHDGALGEKEAAFVDTMSVWEGVPSPKQQKWLRDIAARFAKATA